MLVPALAIPSSGQKKTIMLPYIRIMKTKPNP